MTDAVFSAYIAAGSTLLAALAGVAAIIFQLGRQGKLNRNSIEEAERRRLKSRMYEEVEQACRDVAEAQGAFLSRLISASQEIQLASYTHRDGRPYSIPSARVMDLNRLHSEFGDAFSALVSLIERRQFVAPGILVFRTALSAAAHRSREQFNREFFPMAMPMLPMDRPGDQGPFPYTPPITSGGG